MLTCLVPVLAFLHQSVACVFFLSKSTGPTQARLVRISQVWKKPEWRFYQTVGGKVWRYVQSFRRHNTSIGRTDRDRKAICAFSCMLTRDGNAKLVAICGIQKALKLSSGIARNIGDTEQTASNSSRGLITVIFHLHFWRWYITPRTKRPVPQGLYRVGQQKASRLLFTSNKMSAFFASVYLTVDRIIQKVVD